jgi:hypothetical protein
MPSIPECSSRDEAYRFLARHGTIKKGSGRNRPLEVVRWPSGAAAPPPPDGFPCDYAPPLSW